RRCVGHAPAQPWLDGGRADRAWLLPPAVRRPAPAAPPARRLDAALREPAPPAPPPPAVGAASAPPAVPPPVPRAHSAPRPEPVDRVFAGLRALHRSLERAGALQHFHFFVLSDTADPASAVREEEAWFDWCRAADGFDRIFYRRRKVRLERKSGNVADFCRRWGA